MVRIAIALGIIGACATGAAADDWALAVDGACADAVAFRARVEAQRVRAGAVDAVRIDVALSPAATGDGWRVRVELTGADGAIVTRELDGATCAAVNDAAILIVAQLIDGAVRAVPPPPPPDPGPRALAPIAGADEPPRPTSLSEPVSIRIGAALGADVGSLPSASPGVRVQLDVGYWRTVGSLGFARWLEVTELDARGEGLSVSAWQFHAGLRLRAARWLELGPQVEIGQLAARGRGVDTELDGTGSWQAVGGVARVPVATWGRLDLALQIEALAPLGAPTFVVDGEPRYRPGTVVRAMFGVTWRLFDGTRGVWP